LIILLNCASIFLVLFDVGFQGQKSAPTSRDAVRDALLRRPQGECDHRTLAEPAYSVRDNETVTAPATFYDEIGGHPVFAGIVERFYAEVADDPVLRPLYPEEDLGPAEVRLRMFLEQYWGGPRTYSDLRGHPRLRMRHAPFVIGLKERDAWLHAMRIAVDGADLDDQHRERLWAYLEMAADSMVNSLS